MKPRGSPDYINEIFENAVRRAKPIVDKGLEPFIKYGHPPLTEKVTLAMLKRLPPDQAIALLRAELRRTMKRDDLTGQPVPDRDTIELVTRYMQGMEVDDGPR